MSAGCCNHTGDPQRGNENYRRVLWAVLGINAAMFAIEVAAGVAAGSASLQADALDFLGDAGNYAISLFVVGMALRYRAMAAFIKGATMGVFGVWVLGVTAWHVWHKPASAVTMVRGMAAICQTASFGLRGLPGAMPCAQWSARVSCARQQLLLLAALTCLEPKLASRRDRSCNHGGLALQGLLVSTGREPSCGFDFASVI
jgi:hypothetical protein